MAAPVIASKSSIIGALNFTSRTVAAPSGINDGDLLLLVIALDGNPTAFVPPTGFTEISPNDGFKAPSDQATLYVAFKIASSESGSYTTSWTTGQHNVTNMYRITGTVSGSEIQDPGNTNTGTSTTPLASSFVTDTDDSLALAFEAGDRRNLSFVTGNSWTVEDADATGGGTASVASIIAKKTIGTKGATLNTTSLFALAQSEEWVTIQLAIRSVELVATNTKTFTLNAILKATLTKIFLIDSVLREIKTKIFTLDARLVNRITKTFDLDAKLKGTQTKTFLINCILNLVDLTKTFTIDARLVNRRTKTFLIDAALNTLALTKTFLIDAHFKAIPLKTFLLDGVLIDTLTKTYSLDAIIELVQTKIFTLNAILQNNFTKTFLLDGALSNTFNKTFSANAILFQQTIKSFLLGALLLGTPQKTFFIDAILEANPNVLPEITDIDLISVATRSTPLTPIAPTNINLISQKTTPIPVEDGS